MFTPVLMLGLETDQVFAFRYISQVRQEIAIRLHARLYPGGVGPSKVSFYACLPALFKLASNMVDCSGGLALRRESSWVRASR